jgi:chromosome segregation ATPase
LVSESPMREDSPAFSLTGVHILLDNALPTWNNADDTQQVEDRAEKQMSEAKEQDHRLVDQVTPMPEMLPASPGPSIEDNQFFKPMSDTLTVTTEEPAGGAKKKKKKKKKAVKATQPVESSQQPGGDHVEEIPKTPHDPSPELLLEGYLAELGLNLKTAADTLSREPAVNARVEDLENRLSGFVVHVTALTGQLESANDRQQNLKGLLDEAQKELQDARDYEQQLLKKNHILEATGEDVEQLRDMLRDVGGDLVEAKERLKELEEQEKASLSTKKELKARVSQLSNELLEDRKIGMAIKDAQAQTKLSEAQAASRLNELNETTTKLKSIEGDLISVRSELATVSAEKNKLSATLADLSTKYQNLEHIEKEARESIASIQTKLALKEKEITKLRSDLNDLRNSKAKIEDSLCSTRQALSTVESERNDIQQLEHIARDESARLQRGAVSFQERILSLESLHASLRNEQNSLTEEVHIKTAQVESAKALMQNLREQTTEMGHQAREAKERCEALEDELSEAHKLLSERAREAGTMRRLLDEAEGQEAGRIKDAREKLEVAIEERDHLVEEITLLRKNNAKGSGLMDKSLQEKEFTVKDLSAKYDVARKEVEKLRRMNKDVESRLQEARKEADDATLKLSRLSKSLVIATRGELVNGTE